MKKSLRKTLVLIIAASILVMPVYAADSQSKEISKNVNTTETLMADKIVENNNLLNEIKVNGKISTEVYENPTTGYTWKFEVTGDKGVIDYTFLDKINDNKVKEEPMICGAGSNKILTIKGLKAGKAKLKMSLVRPWEKDVEPAKIMEFDIVVK